MSLRSTCVAAALVGLLGALASPARAQGVDDFGTYRGRGRERPSESPQNMALEIRVGRYVPTIDDEFGDGQTPYRTIFGTKNRYSVGVEVDWQALRIPYLGTLGPGFSIGYTKLSGKSRLERDLSAPAQEESSLTIFPAYLAAVLRVDFLARETPVPLVPFAKLGVGAALWSVGDGDGTASAGDVVGRGLSTGLQFALGGMLLLDTLDQDAAVEMDSTTGINSSYLFAEWHVSKLNGFGSGNQMQVGTNTWVVGLAFEM